MMRSQEGFVEILGIKADLQAFVVFFSDVCEQAHLIGKSFDAFYHLMFLPYLELLFDCVCYGNVDMVAH